MDGSKVHVIVGILFQEMSNVVGLEMMVDELGSGVSGIRGGAQKLDDSAGQVVIGVRIRGRNSP